MRVNGGRSMENHSLDTFNAGEIAMALYELEKFKQKLMAIKIKNEGYEFVETDKEKEKSKDNDS